MLGAGGTPGLRQADFSGSAVTLAGAAQLACAAGLEGIGLAPMCVPAPLLDELSHTCPNLVRLSVGGLHMPAACDEMSEGAEESSADRPPASRVGGRSCGLPSLPLPTGLVPAAKRTTAEEATMGHSSVWRPVLPGVRELQLLGCRVHGVHVLSRAGGLYKGSRLTATFPGLTALEITGAWEVDSCAVEALHDLLTSASPRLQRLRLEGTPRRPLPSAALPRLLAAPAAPGGPGLEALELLCVGGLNDEWMVGVAALAAKSVRCPFKEVRSLMLGGPPPLPPPADEGIPLPMTAPLLAPPPHASAGKVSAAAATAASTVAALAAATAAALGLGGGSKTAALPPTSPGPGGSAAVSSQAVDGGKRAATAAVSDKGLVRLFGCSRLQRLELHHIQAISMAGVRALVHGVPGLESVLCVACPVVTTAPQNKVALMGVLDGVRTVMIRVVAE
jgi:hypothetical protein